MMYGWCCPSEDDVHRLLGLFSRNARCGIRPAVDSRKSQASVYAVAAGPSLIPSPRTS